MANNDFSKKFLYLDFLKDLNINLNNDIYDYHLNHSFHTRFHFYQKNYLLKN